MYQIQKHRTKIRTSRREDHITSSGARSSLSTASLLLPQPMILKHELAGFPISLAFFSDRFRNGWVFFLSLFPVLRLPLYEFGRSRVAANTLIEVISLSCRFPPPVETPELKTSSSNTLKSRPLASVSAHPLAPTRRLAKPYCGDHMRAPAIRRVGGVGRKESPFHSESVFSFTVPETRW